MNALARVIKIFCSLDFRASDGETVDNNPQNPPGTARTHHMHNYAVLNGQVQTASIGKMMGPIASRKTVEDIRNHHVPAAANATRPIVTMMPSRVQHHMLRWRPSLLRLAPGLTRNMPESLQKAAR